MLAPVTILIPEIFTGWFELAWSCIWICITLAGSCKEDSSCKAYKFAFGYSVPDSPSEEVSCKRFPISSSVKATSSF